MTKKQYLKVIERIIESPRNDLQKITMLKYSFETYVEDNRTTVKEDVLEIIQDEIDSIRHNLPFTHDDEVKLDKLVDLYCTIDNIIK